MPDYIIDSEDAMQVKGKELGRRLIAPSIVYLSGNLGAGKTTLARGILRGLGYQGKVKSPTYTLIESYETTQGIIYHCDLYRLNDPEELEHIGFSDYLNETTILLIEWPEKAFNLLPPANFTINIQHHTQNSRLLSIAS
jgi:tRNA threonylcarbamoyladenosine biosynthesis protein TsaE